MDKGVLYKIPPPLWIQKDKGGECLRRLHVNKMM